MLYELVTITRPKRIHEAKELARATGQMILAQRGVVRSIANWGQYLLPAPIRQNMERHDFGHHTVMRFDCSPGTQTAVKKMLRVDPRVIRYTLVKLGDGTLAGTNEYADIEWTRRLSDDRALRREQAAFLKMNSIGR